MIDRLLDKKASKKRFKLLKDRLQNEIGLEVDDRVVKLINELIAIAFGEFVEGTINGYIERWQKELTPDTERIDMSFMANAQLKHGSLSKKDFDVA